jgi:acyl-homoserine-lactone acylase
MKISLLLALFLVCCAGARADEAGHWREEAARVTITRDQWGIAHIHGKSDADAVFGAIYAQAEDDFSRIERNYLLALGWLAQAEGEGEGGNALYSDLRQRLFVDVADLQRDYRQSPVWLRRLMNAWADGLNYYLLIHPDHPAKVIKHFEPWMALSFTEGSIGGDIETIDLAKLEEFYGRHPTPSPEKIHAPGGSNGFAIAPALSASGHALLWINPHTSFYFRSELQMTSDQGLDVYGAATWGQFFIYQGFNRHNGWMHTSYGGDAIDEYAESIVETPKGLFYRYGTGLRKITTRTIDIPYKQGNHLDFRRFTLYASHHGPIIRSEKGKWIAIQLLQEPVAALEQSYLRTKTVDYQGFYQTQLMRTDSSNNTVYADGDGTIAYFHGNFIPKRNPAFDFTHPVDGSDPATEWLGKTPLEDTIMVVNPKTGWVQNTNNWPFHAAGPDSPKRENYPRYMWSRGENARGYHAIEVLEKLHDTTLDSLIAAAYDGHLTAFDILLPPLLAAYDQLPETDPRRAALQAPIDSLRGWDHRAGVDSAPTALAIFWGRALITSKSQAAHEAEQPIYDYLVEKITDSERLDAFTSAIATLRDDFGDWRIAWGEINRFQRLTDDIIQPNDDAKPSLPIGMAASIWGALASFDTSGPQRTKRLYGSVGNSFVAAVEFGPTIHAKAIMSGGESGDPASKHFTDQAEIYSKGRFRDVLFYPEDIKAHAERVYHPGG